MNIPTFLKHTPLDNSLLLGFYGGGNYGDELLLEVLANLLAGQGTKDVSVAYQRPDQYQTFHHDFGFERVAMHNRRALSKAMLHSRNIVVGGGGLWGMDTNLNVLLMSVALLICRRLLGKKVHLVAVGYYHSAPLLGRIAAWCAAKAANTIIARDKESYGNFKRLHAKTYQDKDIAWHIDDLDLVPYLPDLERLEEQLAVAGKTLFVTLRRFHGEQKFHLAAVIGQCLKQNTTKPIIIALLEPRHVDPSGYELLQSWQKTYPNVQIVDFSFNPLALFLFFRKYHSQLVFIGPQFHAILSAHLTGVPYLPLAYDNKVTGLLERIAPQQKPFSIHSLRALDVQRFIDRNYEAAL